MRYLLSHASQAVLTRLAKERTLCAFDFDGTLAPIVEHPDRAGLRFCTRRLLTELAALYPCVVLSGRGRQDVLRRLGGVGIDAVVGSHGADRDGGTGPSHRQVRQWKTAIEEALGTSPGLWVEDKGISLAVHYRQSPRRAEARRRILRATEGLERVRIIGGKAVVNLVAEEAPNKGMALVTERDRLGCAWVLYVGDDENDEDAFTIDGNLIPVRIGRKQGSAAQFYLRSQGEIDILLDELVRRRRLLHANRIPV